MRCPTCNKGTLVRVKEQHVQYGVDLGAFPGEKCDACGELFTAGSVMQRIEAAAKAKGVWGLGRKTKVTRTGNSLAVRIPKELAEHLHIKEGKDAFIHPEKDKLVIEFG
jgi:hypothetical protein